MSRAAVLSLHTSPLELPGQGDAGGMNVYVRELVSSLAQARVDSTVYVRRHNSAPEVVQVEPGFRVVHIPAGPADLPKEQLPTVLRQFADGVRDRLSSEPADVLHANYWLSGMVGHWLKHELDLPLVCTFHTLAKVKADAGDAEPRRRAEAEAEVIDCADVITANSVTEMQELARLYRADPRRIDVVAPGVDSALFSPGAQRGARAALGIGSEPVLAFVGRIQPLKGLGIAVEALAELHRSHPDARLLAVGGASGVEGEQELARVRALIALHGLDDYVQIVPPQPHHRLCTYYRAADVCIVPSRSESFGLVALEAAACGVPVVSADVGGLRTIVDHGRTGLRIAERDPTHYAQAVRGLLDDPQRAAAMSRRAAEMARRYSWTATAARLRRIFDDLSARVPVDCTA